MSVATTTSKIQYTLTTGAQALAVPFYFLDNAHIKAVTVATETLPSITLVLGTDYTLTGAGNPAGGTLTTIATVGNSLAAGSKVVIKRNLPITQPTSYSPNDAFPAKVHEAALDRGIMIAQQSDEQSDRAIRFPEDDSTAAELPSVADRASKALGFNASGALEMKTVVGADGILEDESVGESALQGAFRSRAQASVALMKAQSYTNAKTGDRVELLGYYARGDGGGGLLYVDKADTTTPDNGGTVFVANDGTRLKRFTDAVINVRWFGAKGDGVTNEYSVIMLAIAALTTMGGGVIYFPAGTYLSNSSISVPNNGNLYRFVGDGIRLTKLKSGIVSGSATALFMCVGNITNRCYVNFEKMWLQGNNAANVSGIYSLYGTPSSYFKDVMILGFIDGIRIGRNYLTSFYNVQCQLNVNGVVVGYDIAGAQAVCNNINFYGGQYASNTNYGMWLYGIRNLGVYGGDVESNGVNGILADYVFGGKFSSTYSESSLVTHMTDSHFAFTNCRGISFDNTNISNWYAGNKLIRINGSSGISIRGINCELGVGSTTNRAGTAIHVTNSQGVSVDGCEFDNISTPIVVSTNGRISINECYFTYGTTPVTMPNESYSNLIWNSAYDTDVTSSSFGASCRVIATRQGGTTFRQNWTA